MTSFTTMKTASQQERTPWVAGNRWAPSYWVLSKPSFPGWAVPPASRVGQRPTPPTFSLHARKSQHQPHRTSGWLLNGEIIDNSHAHCFSSSQSNCVATLPPVNSWEHQYPRLLLLSVLFYSGSKDEGWHRRKKDDKHIKAGRHNWISLNYKEIRQKQYVKI